MHLKISKSSFFLKDNSAASEEVKSNMQRAENMTDSGLSDCELESDSQVTEGVLEGERCRGAGEMGNCEGIRGRI